MNETLVGRLWLYFGSAIFLLSFFILGQTQQYFVRVEDSYGWSILGMVFLGIPFVLFHWMSLLYAVRSPMSHWAGKIPVFPSWNLELGRTEAKFLQGLLLTLFIIVPLYCQLHFLNKYMHGHAYYVHESGETLRVSGWEQHLLLDEPKYPLSGTKNTYGDTNMSYYPRYGSWALLLFEVGILGLGLCFASVVFSTRERNPVSRYLWSRYLSRGLRAYGILVAPSPDLASADRSAANRDAFGFDLFISHAHEDKRSLVEALVKRLKSKDLKVWYDSQQMRPGMSITHEVNMGLAASRYTLVILSPAFFRKLWTKLELEFLLELEEKAGEIMIPVWHGLGAAELIDISERLADRLALNSADGLERLVDDILARVMK